MRPGANVAIETKLLRLLTAELINIQALTVHVLQTQEHWLQELCCVCVSVWVIKILIIERYYRIEFRGQSQLVYSHYMQAAMITRCLRIGWVVVREVICRGGYKK